MKPLKRSYHLSGSDLKLLALIAMAIDHFAAVVILNKIIMPNVPLSPDSDVWIWYQIYSFMRFVGRIAFPIFCFLLVEGYTHTSNKKKYALRLFLFAVISEIPFDLAFKQSFFDTSYQNVFFTLLIGFLVIWCIDLCDHLPGSVFWQIFVLCAGSFLAYALKTDYDYKGVVLIVILYLFRNQKVLRTIAGCISLLWEAPACLAFIPIHFYDGTRGSSIKYFFYLFYPLHLLLYVGIEFLL